jgi:uncharacterized membrane protein YbhN (UPF0104 family)
VDSLLRAIETFGDRLAAIGWGAVALALLCHVAKAAARSRAWRNVVAAAYPAARVPWRTVFGAFVAGAGANALLPARAGDVLRLFLVHRTIPGATYSTLAATLLVGAIFDIAAASALVVWALTLGVLPSLDVLPRLPAIDWFWVFQSPRAAGVVAAAALVLGFAFGLWAVRHVEAFRARVAQGFAVLARPRDYLGHVVPWQVLDWAFRLATIAFMLSAFGLDVTPRSVGLVQVTEALSSALPLTPAGIGTEQALLVYIFRGEVPASDLLAFSAGMRVIIILANVALGVVVLVATLRTLRWRRAVADVTARSDGPA